MLTYFLSYRQTPCHTERSEVSTNLKCEFAFLRCLKFFGFFATLKMTRFLWQMFEIFCYDCALQVAVSPVLLAQNDSSVDFSPFCKRLKMTNQVFFSLRFAPCKLLGRFALTHSAQNDKILQKYWNEICKKIKKNHKFSFKIQYFCKNLKNFLLELQKRHYVSQSCVTMAVLKRKFAFKKRDWRERKWLS